MGAGAGGVDNRGAKTDDDGEYSLYGTQTERYIVLRIIFPFRVDPSLSVPCYILICIFAEKLCHTNNQKRRI